MGVLRRADVTLSMWERRGQKKRTSKESKPVRRRDVKLVSDNMGTLMCDK